MALFSGVFDGEFQRHLQWWDSLTTSIIIGKKHQNFFQSTSICIKIPDSFEGNSSTAVEFISWHHEERRSSQGRAFSLWLQIMWRLWIHLRRKYCSLNYEFSSIVKIAVWINFEVWILVRLSEVTNVGFDSAKRPLFELMCALSSNNCVLPSEVDIMDMVCLNGMVKSSRRDHSWIYHNSVAANCQEEHGC